MLKSNKASKYAVQKNVVTLKYKFGEHRTQLEKNITRRKIQTAAVMSVAKHQH